MASALPAVSVTCLGTRRHRVGSRREPQPIPPIKLLSFASWFVCHFFRLGFLAHVGYVSKSGQGRVVQNLRFSPRSSFQNSPWDPQSPHSSRPESGPGGGGLGQARSCGREVPSRLPSLSRFIGKVTALLGPLSESLRPGQRAGEKRPPTLPTPPLHPSHPPPWPCTLLPGGPPRSQWYQEMMQST